MQRSLAGALAAAIVLLGGPVGAAGDEPEAGPSRAEAVAIVLGSDPRFAELPDWEDLFRESQAEFRVLETMTAVDYYRVLGPTLASWSDLGTVTLRYPRSWLIETTLVEDCIEADRPVEAFPVADPCAWRHTWVHHVGSDGSLTLVLDEGDPESMPAGGETAE